MKTHPAPQPAAAPEPTLASDTPPAQRWHYPFPTKTQKEVTRPQTFYEAFAQMDDGYFPLGVNGFPHGGVHFGPGCAPHFDLASGVRCIADGEIIAYLLDDTYPKLHFTQDDHWAIYSTGFVLVRHVLALPPLPNGTASSNDTQTLYSLYMHMASWSTYLANGTIKRPGWWIGVEALRIGNADRQSGGEAKGALVRTEPKAGVNGSYMAGQAVGFLPEGSEVRIGERYGPWGHIASISAGGMVSPDSGGLFGGDDDLNGPWYRPDGAPDNRPVTPRGDWGWIYLHDQHAVAEPTDVGRVVIPPQSIPVKAGTLLGQLGEYIDYERSSPLPPVPARQLLHLEVFAGEDFKAFVDKSRARAAQLPADQKTLLVVKAGTHLVTHMARPDRQLADLHPRYFAVARPTPDSPTEGPWVKVQPYVQLPHGIGKERDGTPVWIERGRLEEATANTPAWSAFPLQLKSANGPANAFTMTFARAELDALDDRDRAVDDKGQFWWCIRVGMGDGRQGTGWVSQNHPNTAWESPWAWPGFEIVDATDITLTDAFQRNLVVTGSADRQEAGKFMEAAGRVDASPLLRRLQHILRGYIERDVHGKVIPAKYAVNARLLRASMRAPWLASDMSHVILRYESEWGGNMSRWEAITPLMRNAGENWQCELQRIQKLQWWNEVNGKVAGFPASPVVYHIHPIALVGNFSGCQTECKTKIYEFQTSDGVFRVSKEAFEFILSTEGYRDCPYVPGGDQSSGVTIGYGYDLGQQQTSTVSSDLEGIFSPQQIARLQTACGMRGDHARKIVASLSDIPVTKEMALKLAVVMKRRYSQQTVDAFPGITKLHPHCQGALLSLVINRGPSMEDRPRQRTRQQMRAIRSDVASSNIGDVPAQLRAMKILWDSIRQRGLVNRREEEAKLFEKGINCDCWR